jgi:hypothetical protein
MSSEAGGDDMAGEYTDENRHVGSGRAVTAGDTDRNYPVKFTC